MITKGGWEHVNRCKSCGHITHIGDIHYIHEREPCRECGQIDWEQKIVARKVHTKKSRFWWLPFVTVTTTEWEFLKETGEL